ncbi:MAG TPA: sigma-70 family RNA polymerase sigma factor [Gemmataceae bacterium]|nr:sigma-70 family RNA polymerase sigma factor [Gemmataceae bacterium]
MIRSAAVPRITLLTELLHDARCGSAEALGQLFQACRGYLLTVARQEMAAALRAKVDAADIVQETFIEATRDFTVFRGETEQELLGWLRGILRHNLADLSRYFQMCCRSLSQEVRLLDQLANFLIAGSARGKAWTVCEQLIAQEQCLALETALQHLPTTYRWVLQLRYGERCSFSEIGNRLQRSPEAARKLVCRSLQCLRQEMRVHSEV